MKKFASILFTLVLVGVVGAQPEVPSFPSIRSAQQDEAPYAVFLYDYDRGLFCAGAIIHPNWVLTAASCLTNNTFSVIAGIHDLKQLNELKEFTEDEEVDETNETNDSHIQIRTIPNDKHYIVHELYENEVGNDIALINITEPFDLSMSVRVKGIPLPIKRNVHRGFGTIYGWDFGTGGQKPMHLSAMHAQVFDYNTCKKFQDFGAVVQPFHLCTRIAVGPSFRDAGAPLVLDTADSPALIGLATSGNVVCDATNGRPSIYTNVLSFRRWIEEKMFGKNYKNFYNGK